MTDTLTTHYDPATVEQAVQAHWTETDAYDHVREQNADGERFTFVDGPPFTTGDMHVGTAWGKVLKDALLRQRRMLGYDVRARPGYDTHGLPVEVQVEQAHDFTAKRDVEDYGLAAFLEECRTFAAGQEDAMAAEFQDLGVWMDWEESYTTRSADYMETVWSAFAALHEDGMVSRDERVVNVCPRCETALADAELEYDQRTTTAAFVGFPLRTAGSEGGDADADGLLLAWTTTPWTVVGNEFVAVDRGATYARVARPAGPDLFLAESCVAPAMDRLGVADDEVEATLPGEALVGRTYDHPLRDRLPDHPVPRGSVVHADYVETDRTGVVHSAPGFGHEDYERGRELDLPVFSPVRQDGTFTDAAGPFAGQDVRAAVDGVLTALEETGSLVGTESYSHEYPHCPRCDTDVLYAASEQWLVTVTAVRAALLEALEDVDFHPQSARDTRFRHLVESAPDWNVSRQRYWGTPLPVWVCEDCGADRVVESRAALVEHSDRETPPDDLHRTAVDDLVLTCPDCGGDGHRVEDVLDVWFDSAVAAWHSLDALPGEDPSPPGVPADLVVEGQDQVRGWFLMQLYLGVLLAEEAPYERVLMHGFAMLDGEAMSKSRGHVLRPPDVVAEHGRDALRCHLLGHAQQEQDVNLQSDLAGVGEVRDRLDVVWNTVRFATMYMAADDHDPVPCRDADLDAARTALDDWVLSRLAEVVETATAAFDDLRPNDALEAALSFLVADVSRYYVQSVRDRVWTAAATDSKAAAYDTLGTVLHTAVRLLAPFAPFLTERLYDALDGTETTVHATGWPTVEAVGDAAGATGAGEASLDGVRDESLEAEVAVLREVEEAVSRGRQAAGRKHRWPVPTVVVEVADSETARADRLRTAVETHRTHLADRLNAKAVRVTDDYDRARTVLEPDMSELGPAFGEDADAVAAAVRGREASQSPVAVEVDGERVTLTEAQVDVVERLPDDVEASDLEWGRVYVDTALSPALRAEGLARDAVRRLQSMRADLDLDLGDRVRVHVGPPESDVAAAVRERREWVLEQVRGVDLVEGAVDAPDDAAATGTTETWTVAGEAVELGVEPVGAPAEERGLSR